MKKATKIAALAITLVLFVSADMQEKQVYICDSKTAKKYHYKKDCRGLNRCTSPIEKITLSEAKKLKITLCGWED